jgi:putative DNA primase/helicase
MMLRKTRTPYDPNADRKLWEKTLEEIVTKIDIGGPSANIFEDQLEYHKKIWGLSVTGETRDEVLFIHQGAGGSGKTVITGTVQNAMGQYVQQVSPDIFISKSDHYTPSYELANGVGVRIFLTNESKEGGKINGQLIKQIATEGQEFNARQIRERPFTYTLRGKAHLVLNPPPVIDEHDKSIKRRLHMIRYLEDFTDRADLTLKKTLKTEARGILAWLVEGAISYYRDGLKPTKAVSQAVAELFDDSDPLYGFVDCTLEESEKDRVSSRELFKAFKSHCNGMMVNTDKIDPRPFGRMFNAQLKLKGWKYRKFASNGETVYIGMRYKAVNEYE